MRLRWLLPSCVLWAGFAVGAAGAPDFSDAIRWYDSAGFPDVKDLPYVRVSTSGSSTEGKAKGSHNDLLVEGFLVRDEAAGFTIFSCILLPMNTLFRNPWHPPLTTWYLPHKLSEPGYEIRSDYQILDFKKVSSDALKSAQRTAKSHDGLSRTQIFALARAALQKNLAETGNALMRLAANIPDPRTGKADPSTLVALLQQQIGESVLGKAEMDAADPSTSWPELYERYDSFGTRFPASDKVAYAREAADVLRRMVAEQAMHRQAPLDRMTLAEQVEENIYQLREFTVEPLVVKNGATTAFDYTHTGRDGMTPMRRLVAFGHAAVPPLMEALNDTSFARFRDPNVDLILLSLSPRSMRVNDLALGVLEQISGRRFPRPVDGSTRRQVEAWWTEVARSDPKEPPISEETRRRLDGL